MNNLCCRHIVETFINVLLKIKIMCKHNTYFLIAIFNNKQYHNLMLQCKTKKQCLWLVTKLVRVNESYLHCFTCYNKLNFVVNFALLCWHTNGFLVSTMYIHVSFQWRLGCDIFLGFYIFWWIALECLFNGNWLGKVLPHSVHVHSRQFSSWYEASLALGNNLWNVLHLYDVTPQSVSSILSFPFFLQSYQRQRSLYIHCQCFSIKKSSKSLGSCVDAPLRGLPKDCLFSKVLWDYSPSPLKL